MPQHFPIVRSRREFFSESFCGFGAIALGALMQQDLGAASTVNPLAPKPPHMPDKAKAKAVIFLFLAGGPSHMDSFDPEAAAEQNERAEEAGQLWPVQIRIAPDERHGAAWQQADLQSLWQERDRSLGCIPVSRRVYRRSGGDPILSLRQRFSRRGAVSAFFRPASSGFPEHGFLDSLRPGLGKRFSSGLRRDARSCTAPCRAEIRCTGTVSFRPFISRPYFGRASARC